MRSTTKPPLPGRPTPPPRRKPAIAHGRSACALFERTRPRTPDALWRFVHESLGYRVPREPVLDGSDAPFDYLLHAFFEGAARSPLPLRERDRVRANEPEHPPADAAAGNPALTPAFSQSGRGGQAASADAVVWAARGGGKTVLGAVATMLDLLFKPGIQVRILAGSLEQSSRMFEHLLQLSRRPAVRPMLLGEPTRRRVLLRNGSRAELLATSHASIRGIRVQKLRCDEAELIDEEFWQAAQLTTRSAERGGRRVVGAVEALSTMHRPGGLMSRLVARDGVRRFRWTAIDVLERCPPARDCGACPLLADCRGAAKRAAGFLPIDDLIRMRERAGDATWDAEMMCRGASLEHRVFPSFDVARHVGRDAGACAEAPIVAGIDFGLRAPLVMLWARVMPGAGADPRLATVEVFDEHHEEGLTLDEHLARIEGRGHPRPAWIGIDPAGEARSAQTGMSDADVLRRRGYRTRTVRLPVRTGLDAVRRRFDRGTLRVHPRCTRLVAALLSYRYPRGDAAGAAETPVHDGASHACDALRYLVASLEGAPGPVSVRGY